MTRSSASGGARRPIPGRRLCPALLWTLLLTELASIGASAGATGHFSPSQFIGFVTAITGPVYFARGSQRARLMMAAILLALVAFAAFHMVFMSYRVSVHSVSLVVQAVIRLGVAILLLTPQAKRFASALRSRSRGRGGTHGLRPPCRSLRRIGFGRGRPLFPSHPLRPRARLDETCVNHADPEAVISFPRETAA